jgi:anti-sigma factor RsiW
MTSSECTLRYREAIHDLVDGTLGPLRRAELQQHLDLCDDCRALADDLLKIRHATESLDPLAPPDRVWLQVAGRLRQEGRVTAPPAAAARRNRVALLALAAALTIAVGSSLVLLWPGTREAPSPQQAASNVPAADSVESISQELQLAEQHYQNVIVRLEQLAKSGDGSIDPQTAATLQKTLQVIDQAIAESRAALRNEPQSAPARDSLFDALRRKVTLLQDTIALMNEMRKGNAAGAAQIVEGTNKS